MLARLPRSFGTLPALRNAAPVASRRYASGAYLHDVTPVELAYDAYAAPSGNTTDGALVVLHGLLGSKRNWHSLCKSLAHDLARPVYALDLRNHGHSPAAAPHTYAAMAADVLAFLAAHRLSRVQLLGHSMGGKAAMAAALAAPDALEKLVVADIAPAAGAMSPEFAAYVDAMARVQEMGLRSRKEAQAVLRETESDPAVLAFLLTNLESTAEGTVRFRLPLDILGTSIDHVGAFPFAPGAHIWEGPTLFIKGEKSKYINRKNLPIAEQLFPNMRLETLDAGHWVHAERPHEFKQLLLDFLGKGPA